MDFDIDYIANNNHLRHVNPYIKIAIALVCLIVTLIVNTIPLDIIIFLAMAIGIIGFARVYYKDYLKFISIPAAFAILTCIFLIFFFGTGHVIWDSGIWGVVIREDALQLGILTFFRVFACFSCLGFLALTTPIAEVLHALTLIKVPKIFIEISLLMYNAIFIFLDQLSTMKHAQETRLGYVNGKRAYHSLGMLFSNLFFKSLDKSESMQRSLDSRGYTGDLPVYKPDSIK